MRLEFIPPGAISSQVLLVSETDDPWPEATPGAAETLGGDARTRIAAGARRFRQLLDFAAADDRTSRSRSARRHS